MNKLEFRQLLQEGGGYKIKMGVGVNKMRRLMKAAGLKRPRFESTGFLTISFVRPSFYSTGSSEKTTPKTTPKTETAILALIQTNPRLTKVDLAKELNLTVDVIKYTTKKLTKSGVLRWLGSSKSGQWKINKKRS